MSILRFFDFSRAEPTEHAVHTQPELQTQADGTVCKEAIRVCRLLHQERCFCSSEAEALREAVGGNQADYLYSRFAHNMGWRNVGEAQRFYDSNKRKGGWVY